MNNQLITFKGIVPKIGNDVFLAQGSQIIGDVVLADKVSIWFNTVLRGDVNYIRVGAKTNIQDLSVVHVATNSYPTLIGEDVTIGHRAIIHACTIGDRCLIGMGAIVMDGAVIGNDCLVAAGSLVTEKMNVPDGSVVMGSPAKIVRPLRDKERDWIRWSSLNYQELALSYLKAS